MKKKIYIKKPPRGYLVWLLPLLLLIASLLLLLWLLPRSQAPAGRESEREEDSALTDEASPGDFAAGERLYVRRGECALYERSDSDAQRLASALYGETVEVLQTRQNGRIKGRLEDGTEGWMPVSDLGRLRAPEGETRPFLVLVTGKRVMTHAMSGRLLFRAPMGSILDADYVSDDVCRIRLRDGEEGWISPDGVQQLEDGESIPEPEDAKRLFPSSAMNFYGSRVVPGGMTQEGADMAGLIYIAARVNGLKVPRDLQGQSAFGQPVEVIVDAATGLARPSLFEPGDILFFHDGYDQKKVAFAAVMLERGQALCRLTNDATITIRKLENEPELMRRLMLVRRYFP